MALGPSGISGVAKRAILVDHSSCMSDDIRLPADHEPHACTIMAWAVHQEWGAERTTVERELEEVIRAIADYEAVKLLTPPDLVPAARARRLGPGVEVIPAPVDDIWMRDIAPVFAKRGQ